MDKETIEIRWHGRAGQGVVTAAVTLADVISTEKDLYVQAFPEF
jgi:pyruvate ferredoxin oxidoreductase gamma subunit